jgi:histidinol-phosphate aminotransferase
MRPRLPENIARIAPYVPGRPEEEIGPLPGGERPVKLASNENPLGPSPRAVEAAREALRGSHRYPDGSGNRLRAALSARYSLPPGQIILGNGSTDLVELLARTFLGPDGNAVMAGQSFVMYRIAVLAVNGNAREVPLRDLRHDLPAMADACDGRTVLVFIANPNNPTGTFVTTAEWEELLDRLPGHVLPVLDEAYAEYITRPDYPDGLEALRRGRRVVVLRTFSKIYGLAGLRIGYGFAPADVVEGLNRVRSPFNTSRVGQAAALAALGDEAHLERSRSLNREERAFLEGEFRARGLGTAPSVANFLLADTRQDAETVHKALLDRGIITRPMGPYRFPTSLRITVGTRPENLRLLSALDEVLAGSPSRR